MGRGRIRRVNQVLDNSTINLTESIQEHKSDTTHQSWSVCTHSFVDLTHVPPLVFLFLLKEFYVRGKCNVTTKFRYLQQTLRPALYNAPRPGPAIFVARCLFFLPIFEIYCEEFSHLIICVLRRVLRTGTNTEDLLGAKSLAAQLFLCSVEGKGHDRKLLIKILEVFDVKLEDIQNVKDENDLDAAKVIIEQYIFNLVESKSYKTAATLLKYFSLHHFGESFLSKMIEGKRYKAAEKLAASMGNPTLCVLVQHYIDQSMSNDAYNVIKNYDIKDEFPEVYLKGKQSSLKYFAEKGLWDVAEARTNTDKQQLEYLVNLAMKAGYFEKVEELCDRYSLEGFADVKELQASFENTRFLHLNELEVEDIKWVDDACGLCDATCHIEGCKVVGIDCEFKAIYEKGKKPKVCIMQIASEKVVHILDLIKLFEDVPDVLDNCLSRIFHSPMILKLGYNFQYDVKQLALSYEALECFQHYEMLLDIQNLYGERGGLSGLTKTILGAELNKTRRISNWEQRPLTQNQLEYAALDAAVLLKIYAHVQDHPELDSHIIKVHGMGKPVKQIYVSASGWE